MEQFLGSDQGLSPATITRLTAQWQDEAGAFGSRSLAGSDYVYVWVDGIHLKVRLEADKVCLLVMIGVRADGRKELIALADGFRESAESWADLLRDCQRRGMQAPMLAVGDGALGFWKAVRDVFPETAEQRCWWHKIGNVLAALPKSVHPAAKTALAEIYNAEDKTHASAAAKAFAIEFGAKWPKAAAKISDDLDVLLAFYDFPAEHWIHLRTTNPIESTFATVRLRQRVTKGPGSRAAGVAMAFKLIESAQTRWRCVNAPHLVATRPRRSHLPQRQTRRTTHRHKINNKEVNTQPETHPSTGLDYSSVPAPTAASNHELSTMWIECPLSDLRYRERQVQQQSAAATPSYRTSQPFPSQGSPVRRYGVTPRLVGVAGRGLCRAHCVGCQTFRSGLSDMRGWEAPVFSERTSVGLDVHARSVAAAGLDSVTGRCGSTGCGPIRRRHGLAGRTARPGRGDV